MRIQLEHDLAVFPEAAIDSQQVALRAREQSRAEDEHEAQGNLHRPLSELPAADRRAAAGGPGTDRVFVITEWSSLTRQQLMDLGAQADRSVQSAM